jgi:hypothetical protein
VVNADCVPGKILQCTKTIAGTVLDIQGKFGEHITSFPHHLDGGWPDVDPEDEFVLYAQIQTGQFRGVSAMATGSSKVKRERGLALALVLAAATLEPGRVPADIWQKFGCRRELSQWVSEAIEQFQMMEAAVIVSERHKCNGPLSPVDGGSSP